MRNLKHFWKLNILLVLRCLGEHFTYKLCQKKLIEAFKYQKYTKFNKNCPKMIISNLLYRSKKFDT